jgi:hypothetical protein
VAVVVLLIVAAACTFFAVFVNLFGLRSNGL